MKAFHAPLLLFALPAILVAFAPARHDLLLLDRIALDAGEVWCLWTGHWVHFSTSHLLWNLAVLVSAGAWLEHVRPGLLLRHTILAAPFIGVAVLTFEPALQTYGGLSGLATGVVVLLCLHQLRSPDPLRGLWIGVLALVAAKSASDVASSTAWFAHYATPGIRTSSTAHAAGALAAVFHHTVRRWLVGGAPLPRISPKAKP